MLDVILYYPTSVKTWSYCHGNSTSIYFCIPFKYQSTVAIYPPAYDIALKINDALTYPFDNLAPDAGSGVIANVQVIDGVLLICGILADIKSKNEKVIVFAVKL